MIGKNNKIFFNSNLIFFIFGLGVGLFIWFINNQYYRYIYESKELKKTIESYKKKYSLAEEWIDKKTDNELDKSLNEIIDQWNYALTVLPPYDYIGAKKVMETIESTLLNNDLGYTIDIYRLDDKHFFQKIYFKISLTGDFYKIEKALVDIDKLYPLIRWIEAHSNNNNSLYVKFSFFTCKDSRSKKYSYIKYLKNNVYEYEKYKIKSQIFPFTFWVKNLQKDITNFYNHEMELRELSPAVYKKKELYFKYKYMKNELYYVTTVIDKLMEIEEKEGIQLKEMLVTCCQEIEQGNE